ncbi:endothelial cell-specific chemotaxis regulator isoform X2 [Haemorhous mexicanus]|uniref:endothelial cell-specific chemotaxis regulator isoform X2 n=1 Tax=Haemorhous mexicanus TaxID=30427 RepID=UPI0028BD5430|nr:endothelial cell-specific chemotaxis regulator isoform X2 [Haemorhous mexicanus]
MPLPSLRALLWLLLLLPGSTAPTNSSTPAGAGPSQSTAPSPEAKNHSSEPSVKSTPLTNLSLTSAGQTTTATPSPTTTTTTERGQDSMRNESTTTSATQGASSTQTGTSKPITPAPNSSSQLPEPTPTDEKSPLTVAAFGVISFVVILIVVVIILVSVVSLRFKCNHSKDSEDKQKPGTSMVSESCSADTSHKGNSITLISMKNINTNNSMSYPPSEKVL